MLVPAGTQPERVGVVIQSTVPDINPGDEVLFALKAGLAVTQGKLSPDPKRYLILDQSDLLALLR